MPKDEIVMKAGVYKAAIACTDIPANVINTAMMKCLELGFNPFMAPIEQGAKEEK